MTKNVMIVDDDPSILITIRSLFEAKGFKVFTVDSGIECIAELKNGFKGVILMDIMMPIMNGWDTIEEIKKNGYLTGNVISILTAKDDPGQYIDLYKDVIEDYITKPFDPDELVEKVNGYFQYL
jgi:DNA-binding response OmpR family regulator